MGEKKVEKKEMFQKVRKTIPNILVEISKKM